METGIGKRIKQQRLELNLTQSELASRLGLTSKSTICKIETGVDNLTLDRVVKFAEALECTPGYLMGWDEEETPINKMTTLSALLDDPQALNAIKNLLTLSDEKKEVVYQYINFLCSSN